jgi:predicted TIM-barrel fold metal-dependent hydrolase
MQWTRREFIATSCAAALARPVDVATASIPFIDSHVHVWKHDPQYPFATGANVPPEDASAEMLLNLMRANNVEHTVIIQVIHYKWDNSYLADVLKHYPKQFRGVCRVNPQDPAAPDHLSRLTEVDGFRGVRLSPAEGPQGDWIRGPLMPPLWRRCAALKVPMTLLIPVTRLPDIHPLIDANPDLQVVIDHMADCPVGQPQKLELLLALARFPNVFVKISHMWSLSRQPYPYLDAQAQARQLYKVFSADRLMAGTDWPISLRQLPYAESVALYRNHLNFLTPVDIIRVLSENVQKVWAFTSLRA